MKWLKKVPQSGEQVLAVILEATKAYEEYKVARKGAKLQYEKELLEKGIFVGSRVKVLGSQDGVAGRTAEVKNISGRSVTVIFDDEPGKKWKLQGFSYEVIK